MWRGLYLYIESCIAYLYYNLERGGTCAEVMLMPHCWGLSTPLLGHGQCDEPSDYCMDYEKLAARTFYCTTTYTPWIITDIEI